MVIESIASLSPWISHLLCGSIRSQIPDMPICTFANVLHSTARIAGSSAGGGKLTGGGGLEFAAKKTALRIWTSQYGWQGVSRTRTLPSLLSAERVATASESR